MNLPDIIQQSSGSKNYVKLKDGESVRGVFIGDMFTFHIKWINGKSVESDNKDPDAKTRFKCNFAMVDDQGQLTAKVWEFAYSVFEQLKAINSEYPLETTKVKISRMGTGTDTTYQILPLVSPKDLLTKPQLDAINALPLNPLDKKAAGKEKPPFDPSEELPF